MEALLLAGGKAERLGEAAQGLPKPLVPVGGLPLAAYAVARLVESGVTRVIVACRAGDEESFLRALAGLGAEVEAVGEEEPLGRGGGLRLAATRRQETGPVLALNGDELLDVDFRALLSEHEASGAAGTIVVAQVRSPFGVVDLEIGMLDQKGQEGTPGTARVVLPLRGGPPVPYPFDSTVLDAA